MMDIAMITEALEEKVGAEFKLVKEREDRFQVLNPFIFDDGDQIGMALKREGDNWILTDEGHTFFHLTMDVDEKSLFQGTRERIIKSALALFGAHNRAGELTLSVTEENIASRIFEFAQTILRIADISYLSKERAESAFLSNVDQFVCGKLSPDRYSCEWYEPRDKKQVYRVDYRINGGPKPVFLFALSTAARTKDATITLHRFKEWGVENTPVGVFENSSKIGHKDIERFDDVCDIRYSDFGPSARAAIMQLLHEVSR